MTDDDLHRYLTRLGLAAPVLTDAATLARLQTAHLRRFVFEGIDPFLGRVPSLDWPDLSAKILTGGRGGYCFELNSLYGALLVRLGFAARRVLARVRQRNPVPGHRSHLAWLVNVGGTVWLTDVGFGGPSPLAPLELHPDPQTDAAGTFRFRPDATTGEQVLEVQTERGWHPQYSFDEPHVTDGELLAANYVSATWDQSPFANNLMLSAFVGPVRLGLFNRGFSEDGPDGLRRRDLEDTADLAALFDRVGLDLPAETTARIWDRLS